MAMATADFDKAIVMQGFRFSVELDNDQDVIAYANEVSGFDAEYEVAEFRFGNDSRFTTRKYPGLVKYGNITIKQCMIKGDSKFYELIGKSLAGDSNATYAGEPIGYKHTLTIKMTDIKGDTLETWTVSNAWATKYTGPDLNSTSNDVLVETIEFAHEGIVRGAAAGGGA